MKNDLRILEKSQISSEILVYLIKHPDAQDTLDGILQWWILEREIKYQTKLVKEAIKELVANGFVLEHKSRDSHNHYRINRSKYGEIKALFKQKSW